MNLTEAEILEIQELGGIVLEEAKTPKEKFFKYIKKAIKLMKHGDPEDIAKVAAKGLKMTRDNDILDFAASDEYKNKTGWTSEEKEKFAIYNKLKLKSTDEKNGREIREKGEASANKAKTIDDNLFELEQVVEKAVRKYFKDVELGAEIKSFMTGVATGVAGAM